MKSIFHKIKFGGLSAPDHLQWANVTIDSNQLCQEHYPSLVPEVMICAGGYVRTY